MSTSSKNLYEEQWINLRIQDYATELSQKLYERKNSAVFICVLNGAFMFYSDLLKSIKYPDISCQFMRVKSYTSNGRQGDVQVLKDIECAVKGKDIYIVDDIYDTGKTMSYIYDLLETRNPLNIYGITLVNKQVVQQVPSYITSLIKLNADDWVIGYGMDNDGKCRHETSIRVLNK